MTTTQRPTSHGALTPQYILRKSLCRPPHCADQDMPERKGALSQIECMDWSESYAEPGYTDAPKGILFANWNYFPRGIDTILERYGYAIEWSDEWITCGHCNKAVRTSPDSYGWQPSFIESDGEIECVDCLKEDPASYLESLEDRPNRAMNVPGLDPAEWGYIKLEGDFEHGFHPSQNDNPRAIYARLHADGHKRLLFRIDGKGQFDIGFSVWEESA